VPSLASIELAGLIDINVANNPSSGIHWPVVRYADAGTYEYVETSDWWKDLCRALPCFSALQWPGYATQALSVTINDRPVVIQLWKGWCPKFLGLSGFPGGTGGEVGVYERVLGRAKPSTLDFLPPLIASFILGLLETLSNDQIWWPVTNSDFLSKLSIEFELINPVTDEIFLRSGNELNTYWSNRWMDDASYAKYKAGSPIPAQSTDYVLRFDINGEFRASW
jgi:hypothetical protein